MRWVGNWVGNWLGNWLGAGPPTQVPASVSLSESSFIVTVADEWSVALTESRLFVSSEGDDAVALPTVIELQMVRADDKAFPFVVKDEDGAVVDLTLYTTMTFTVKDMWGGTEVFQRTLAAGDIVVASPLTGALTVNIVPADTSAATIPVGRDRAALVWDLDISTATKKHTVARGDFVLLCEV